MTKKKAVFLPLVLGKTRKKAPCFHFTSRDVTRAQEAGLQAWAPSTVQRRKRALRLWREYEATSGDTQPHRWLLTLLQGLRVSTVLCYGLTLQGMIPSLRGNRLWADTIRAIRKRRGQTTQVQAPVAPVNLLRHLFKLPPSPQRVALLLMFLSASRFGDIQAMKIAGTWRLNNETVLCLQLANFKSDIFGERRVRKYLSIPSPAAQKIVDLLQQPLPSYFTTWKEAYKMGLSCHSMRRTACTLLSERFPEEKIALLTAHTTPTERKSVRRYFDPCPNSEEARCQRLMSRYLWDTLKQKGIQSSN